MKQIALNQVAQFGDELAYLGRVVNSGSLAGPGEITRLVERRLAQALGVDRGQVFLAPSCTAALEISALMLDLREGDEIVMPSYTFVSTATAFARQGARIKFVDVDPNTMNVDPTCVERALTPKTKAVVVVHYAGVGCDMEAFHELAARHGITLVEDAAQAWQAKYGARPLGTFGDFATFSFHESKNLTSGGEGGLLVVKDPAQLRQAEIIREKGTNRGELVRGEVDKYTWLDMGSSYLASELQAAYLCSQLDHANEILAHRLQLWKTYYERLSDVVPAIELPVLPKACQHNAHLFFIKCADPLERQQLMAHLKTKGIQTAFHYIPLHSSPAGRRYGDFVGEDRYTTAEAGRILRLPIHNNIDVADVGRVCSEIEAWYADRQGKRASA